MTGKLATAFLLAKVMQEVNPTPDDRQRIRQRKAARRKRQLRRRRITFLLTVLLFVVAIGIIIMLARMSHKDSLQGSWTIDGITTYEFDGKGSGTLHTSLSDFPFKYDFKDGEISIDFIDEEVNDAVYMLTLSEDKKGMTLQSEDGMTFKLTKDP